MSLRLLVASRTDVGRVRPGNEDAFIVVDEVRLLAVADGMGGHQAGEVASATAIAALLDGLERGNAIDDAITAANDAVFAKASDDASFRGMGTTLTAGVVDGTTFLIGHVGDSRAYLLRDGELRQLTTDHSVIAELVAAGELTEEEALVDPRRSMITRALGIDPTVTVDVLTVDLAPGDRLLLCSDGLTTMIRDDAIAEVLTTEPDRERAADALVDAANAAGGTDNITVVIADIEDDGADDGGGSDDDVPAEPMSLEEASGPAAFEDTDEVPAVEADDPGDRTPEDGPDPDGGPDPDAELEELRAAVEEVAPRRRWWQRRSRP